jgi:hypothetical protein
MGRSELVSVNLRRGGRLPRTGDIGGLASPKVSAVAWSYGDGRARRRSPTLMPPPAGRPRRIERPRLRRQRHRRRRRLRGRRPVELRLPHRRLDLGKQRQLRRRRPGLRHVRRGWPERVRVQHHLPRLRPVLLLESCMGSRAHSRVLLEREARRRRLPAARASAPCASTSTARPPRHRALESRRVLVPAVGGLRVRRAHDHDQRAQAAA